MAGKVEQPEAGCVANDAPPRVTPHLAYFYALAIHGLLSYFARDDRPSLPPEVAAELDRHREWWADAVSSGQEWPTRDKQCGACNNDPMSLLMTYTQTAQILGTSDRTVRRLVASGELPAVRLGRRVRIRRPDLEAYIAALPANRDGAA